MQMNGIVPAVPLLNCRKCLYIACDREILMKYHSLDLTVAPARGIEKRRLEGATSNSPVLSTIEDQIMNYYH